MRVAMRQNRGLLAVLVVIGATALAIFFAVLLTHSGSDQDELWKEAGKAALQVLTVAVLGAVLKLLADHYKDEQERLAKDASFRQDKYDRLVEATNALRRVPILIDADKSVNTFDEQLRQVVEAGLKLRMIKHQIWSSRGLNKPPFPDYRELTYLFESLYYYTDWLIAEFVRAKEPLLEAQRHAENPDLAPDARERAAEQVRLWVPALSAVSDMHEPKGSKAAQDRKAAYERCQKRVDDKLCDAVRWDEEIPEPGGTSWSWLRYEATEELALERITKATLQNRRGGRTNWMPTRRRR
jgi:hypothetical protein